MFRIILQQASNERSQAHREDLIPRTSNQIEIVE